MATNVCTGSHFRALSPVYPEPAPSPPLLLLGDSVLLLHPQYQACKCALLSSLCSCPGIILLKSLFAFLNKALCTLLTCYFTLTVSIIERATFATPSEDVLSCPGRELLVYDIFFPRLL